MRKLVSLPRGGGEKKLGVLAFEVAALMSRAASLWRALGDAPVARLRGEAVRLEGVRRLVADDDAALLSLALAEVACACGTLARDVSRLAARCADPLLRRFEPLFAALVAGGADAHGVRYRDARKMDRKARKMQRLVALTAHLCHETDVLAELEQAPLTRRRAAGAGRGGEARQRQEVERLRAASLWNRTFDYAARLLARSLFTIAARIIHVFDLEPTTNISNPIDDDSSKVSRLSWSSSFVGGSMHSMVHPSDITTDTARQMQRANSGKVTNTSGGDARRFLLSRSRSLKQQLKWPASGKHLIGCVVSGRSKSPVREKWAHSEGHLPLSFSNSQFQSNHHHHSTSKLSTSVFESSRDVLTRAPEASLGAAALAVHYANLIIFIEKLAAAPHHICADERDELYGMLTARIRASLRSRLRPLAKSTSWECDPVLAAEWADTVQRILGWLAPLARNMVRWQAERNFEQRNVASSASVLLLETLHFADRNKTEAAVTELLVGLNYLWRSGRELEAKAKSESAVGGEYEDYLA